MGARSARAAVAPMPVDCSSPLDARVETMPREALAALQVERLRARLVKVRDLRPQLN